MAAHTYYHVGRYEDAATINAMAMRSDSDHLTQTRTSGGLKGALYYGHNLGFGMAGALMSGDRALALKSPITCTALFPIRISPRMAAAMTKGGGSSFTPATSRSACWPCPNRRRKARKR
jgi:hypothetical protein